MLWTGLANLARSPSCKRRRPWWTRLQWWTRLLRWKLLARALKKPARLLLSTRLAQWRRRRKEVPPQPEVVPEQPEEVVLEQLEEVVPEQPEEAPPGQQI